ncbi:MAG: hypothetical protein IT290_10770 [Deltaproteobacteria bacterium]|nr:hypothetical protein [Deltaproteobacteria bacterium]
MGLSLAITWLVAVIAAERFRADDRFFDTGCEWERELGKGEAKLPEAANYFN